MLGKIMEVIYLSVILVQCTHASKMFNRFGANKKPSAALIPIKSINSTLEAIDLRCPGLCLHEASCNSFLIDKSSLQCILYTATMHFITLIPAPDHFFYSVYDLIYRDCLDWFNAGFTNSGVYDITLSTGVKVEAACDMDLDAVGGGWTQIQNRVSNSENFHRPWNDYKDGFGSLSGNFWWGNEKVHLLTSLGNHDFYMWAETYDYYEGFTHYSHFRVLNESTKYTMEIGNKISGIDTLSNFNNKMFSTYDNDNDYWNSGNFANKFSKGGFWYPDNSLMPNGQYHNNQGACPNSRDGIIWVSFKGASTCLYKFKILIRRIENLN